MVTIWVFVLMMHSGRFWVPVEEYRVLGTFQECIQKQVEIRRLYPGERYQLTTCVPAPGTIPTP